MPLQYNITTPLGELLDSLEKDELSIVMIPLKRTFYAISVDSNDCFIVTKGFGGMDGDYESFDRNYVLGKWKDLKSFDVIENTTGDEVGNCIEEYERSKVLSLARGRSLI
jgi:hypothetical protein